ncbi:ParA family protein [Streptomyces sp. SID3343]|uniref:ParA family protein n=1 Tax=Streptomyces sp. SID3343 TaxID=2690260 RepID=UPI001371C650|nr:ParA family protein [Streptomyces sp. SID3343]MYW00223.1 AAA family ATPase [Streptomyces sp. SID3343]
MATRIAMGNNKGGVGKTTVTVRTAEALAALGKRVLVVDMDPQGNSSRRLGVVGDLGKRTISEAIKANTLGAAANSIWPCGWDAEYATRIAVCPSTLALEDRMSEAGVIGAHRRLSIALDGADDGFDYTLFDCPPSLFHLTQLALAAAQYAVGVTEPEYYSIEGALRFRAFVEAQGTNLSNPELSMLGVIAAGYDVRKPAHLGQLEALPETFGDLLWQPTIPVRTAIQDADESQGPLLAQRTDGGREARALFGQLAERLIKATS